MFLFQPLVIHIVKVGHMEYDHMCEECCGNEGQKAYYCIEMNFGVDEVFGLISNDIFLLFTTGRCFARN